MRRINGRRTGLGTHGLADASRMFEPGYDSPEALVIIEKIYRNTYGTQPTKRAFI